MKGQFSTMAILFGKSLTSEMLICLQYLFISDDYWDKLDAAVVCRMLGIEGVAEPTISNLYPIDVRDFIMDDVKCKGSETDLADCPHRSSGHNCGRYEAAGVVCHGGDIFENFNITLLGSHPGEGAVLINGYAVCDDRWDSKDAGVVCRELGYKEGGDATTHINLRRINMKFKNFLLDDVQCNGDESSITECKSNGYFVHNCGLKEGAGVKCKGPSPTLTSPHPTPAFQEDCSSQPLSETNEGQSCLF